MKKERNTLPLFIVLIVFLLYCLSLSGFDSSAKLIIIMVIEVSVIVYFSVKKIP